LRADDHPQPVSRPRTRLARATSGRGVVVHDAPDTARPHRRPMIEPRPAMIEPSPVGDGRGGTTLRDSPRHVTIVVPVRNAEAWFAAQLQALSAQRYDGAWDILVADNGSTDETVSVARSWADRLPLRVVDASARPGINAARNIAAGQADGDLLAFCDGDDLVGPGWLAALAEAAQRFDLVGGRLDEDSLNSAGAPQRPRMPEGALPVALDFLPFAVGANLAIWADVLDRLGGFDERFLLGNDDVELSFRAQVHGHRLGYAPDAVVSYRHRNGHLELFRQFRTYGRSEPLLYADYQRWGMPRPGLGQVARRWARIVLEAPLALLPQERAGWLVRTGFSLGRLSGAIRHRVLYL
jgi:GT2 family glycosyltransferase